MKNKKIENPKITYAQSSDIKSRSFIQYRHDMKKKAIAELEILPWIEEKLRIEYNNKDLQVEKAGGDRFIWFTRGKSMISGEPDYLIKTGDIEQKLEFQYSSGKELKYFDFKVSKIGKKERNKTTRTPYTDRRILYVIKDIGKYAYIEPTWVMEKGKLGNVPAWGSRAAYRVPRETFLSIMLDDEKLKKVINIIELKNTILDFQHEFHEREANTISQSLQKVVDNKEIFQIIPETLEGFYHACVLMEHLNRIPININMWLIYLISYFNINLTSHQMTMLVYAMNFLYSNTKLNQNEINILHETLTNIEAYVSTKFKEKKVTTSINISPVEEIRYFLVIINFLEDMIQDAIFNYDIDKSPIRKIFQTVPDIDAIHTIISGHDE